MNAPSPAFPQPSNYGPPPGFGQPQSAPREPYPPVPAQGRGPSSFSPMSPVPSVEAPRIAGGAAATGARPDDVVDAEPKRVLGGFIYSFQEDGFGKHWVLYEGENLVGRAETNVKCEVPVAHGTTSTRHASLRCTNGQITLQDMKSTNGTYVNGRRLDPNVLTALNDGDQVRFGGFTVNLIVARRQP